MNRKLKILSNFYSIYFLPVELFPLNNWKNIFQISQKIEVIRAVGTRDNDKGVLLPNMQE